MSIRDKLFTMLDTLTDEQLEGLYIFLQQLIPIHEELNEDSLEAMRETEEMEKHPERYRVYTDVNEMMQDFLK